MAFQVKSFLSIIASMINRLRMTQTTITDFNVGAVGRTLLEAPAQEIDELYQQMLHGLIEAIPVSVYKTFTFPALVAQPATNLVQVTITAAAAGTLISGGTVFTPSIGSVTYSSTADATIPAGDTFINVYVAATTPGTVGNLEAETSFTMSPSPAGFVSAVNPSAFVNGTDAETALQQQVRFNQFILSLARSPIPGFQYALLQETFLTDSLGNVTEKVASCVVDEPWKSDPTQPVSLVNCYVHNGVGNTSAQLAAQGLQILQGYVDPSGNKVVGYKAAGVKATVSVATEDDLNVSAVITVASGYDPVATSTAVQSAIFSYIQGIPTGYPYLASTANELARAVPGVTNFVPVSPTVDVSVGPFVKVMPGTLSVIGWFSASGAATAVGSAALTTHITPAAHGVATPIGTATLT